MTTKRYPDPDNSQVRPRALVTQHAPWHRNTAEPCHPRSPGLVCGLSSSSLALRATSLSVTGAAKPDAGQRANAFGFIPNARFKPAPHDVRYPPRLWSQSARDAGDLVLHVTRRSTPRPAAVTDAVQKPTRITPPLRRLPQDDAPQEENQRHRSSSVCHSATLQPPSSSVCHQCSWKPLRAKSG
ncbi:hypothetical protein CSUB01_10021 [Colletotrichum sublineola]|uniref:Uncharacterized protein n=1 Tax=Colletotrichum sublineola TaxID=1173701 RepID=A0A066XKT1_COLSU|nr:hypothetical protein CSUB01_10021 [Colletotrichum sublineola]